MSKASCLESDVEVYNFNVELDKGFIALVKTNKDICKICSEYINYMKDNKCNFRRVEEGYYFINKMEKAVGNQRFKVDKTQSYYKNVYISKIRCLTKNGEKRKCEVVEEKEVKQYIFDSIQLIEFIMMLRSSHKILSDFIKVPDVIFIIRQLELLGIEDIVKQLGQEK